MTMWSLVSLIVVDAVDDGQIGAVRRGRDDNALGAGRQVRGRLVAGCEDAGAFERDVDAELFPRQLRRILDRRHLELVGADVEGIALDLHLAREAAMDAVEAQQMGIGLDRAEVVDGHHVDVLAAGFVDGAHDVAADAAKSVDGYSDSHVFSPWA